MAKDFKNSIVKKDRFKSLIPVADPEPYVKTVQEAQPTLKREIRREAPAAAPTPPETVVSTFRINTEKLKTIKAIAFWDRKKIQDVFDEALEMYINAQPKATVSKAIEEYTKRTS